MEYHDHVATKAAVKDTKRKLSSGSSHGGKQGRSGVWFEDEATESH